MTYAIVNARYSNQPTLEEYSQGKRATTTWEIDPNLRGFKSRHDAKLAFCLAMQELSPKEIYSKEFLNQFFAPLARNCGVRVIKEK